jgi:hypothetical protein
VRQVVSATAIVAVLGGIGGALGGAVIATVFGLVDLLDGGSVWIFTAENFRGVSLVAGIVGAFSGAVLGPLFTWTLLRRAPLWRAISETAFAAAVSVGLLLGLAPPWLGGGWLAIGGVTVLGSTVAAYRLRLEINRRNKLLATESAS